MKWIKDKEILKRNAPMTKYPIRVLSLSMMEIEEGMSFLDIGCGTGSIGLQAAELGLHVTAIDFKEEALNDSIENFNRRNLRANFICGRAPEDLPDEKFDRIFVGGTGGNIIEITEYIEDHLNYDGICVGNFIIMDNAVAFKRELKRRGFETEVRTINSSLEDRLGLNKADNPVTIVKAFRKLNDGKIYPESRVGIEIETKTAEKAEVKVDVSSYSIDGLRILTGIGTGPGKEGYLTLDQVKAIEEADVIFIPESKGKSRAFESIKNFIKNQELIYLDYPMGMVNEDIYEKNAKIIRKCPFKKAVFITIGDPMIYSTFSNTLKILRNNKPDDLEIKSLPGIASFIAAFNRVLIPLAEKSESFLLTDGDFNEKVLNYVDSISILKTGKNKEKYLDLLEKYGFKYVYVKRLSDANETIITDREEIMRDSDYISLIVGRK